MNMNIFCNFWYETNPEPVVRNYARDCAFVKRQYLDNLAGNLEEWRELCIKGFNCKDERTRNFSRASIPTFVKEVPILRKKIREEEKQPDKMFFDSRTPEERQSAINRDIAIVAMAQEAILNAVKNGSKRNSDWVKNPSGGWMKKPQGSQI